MIKLPSVCARLCRFAVFLSLVLGTAFVPTGLAQSQGLVDLGTEYGVTMANGSLPAVEVLKGPDAVKAAFPRWSAKWATDGRPEAELMHLSYLVCAWNDAVYRMAARDAGSMDQGGILVPAGRYQVNHTLYLAGGKFQGEAIGKDNSTVLVMDLRHWLGNEPRLLEAMPEVMKNAGRGVIELSDLRLEAGTEESPSTGIWIASAEAQVHVSHMTIRGFGTQGVLLAEVGNTVFSNVRLRDNASGITMLGCTGPELNFTQVISIGSGILFRVGPWGGKVGQGIVTGGPINISNARVPSQDMPHDRLVDADGPLNMDLSQVKLYFSGIAPAPLCIVRNSTPESRISIKGLQAVGSLTTILEDLTLERSYRRVVPRDHVPFDLCWSPGLSEGALPAQCGDPSDLFVGRSVDQGAMNTPQGTLRSGTAAISIGAETGNVVPALAHGYNCSDLFSFSSGSDTALHTAVNQLAPGALRFPGGTLANFYHPAGLGYGIILSDLVGVAGTSVYENAYQSYLDEQADIATGTVTGNFIYDMIDLAQATNSPVLYVANLYSGTVQETIWALNKLVSSGVTVAGVELGNESHLGAYQARFGSPENYLSIAGPFAQAILTQFPGMKIGLNGAPPGILKGLGPGGTQVAHNWNVVVSGAPYGDALIIHCYSQANNCNQSGVVANFRCGASFSQDYATQKLPAALAELASLGDKKIWITEWNMDGGYNHYGNSIAQSMFYADMSFTMAQQSKVTVSAYHYLLSAYDGYNMLKYAHHVMSPQINYYTSLLMADLYLPGNRMQDVTSDGLNDVRAFAFLSADGSTQHLYLINRSGVAQDLSGYDGTATNVNVATLGGNDIASGTGPNFARSSGDVATVNSTVADIHQVTLAPYGVVHLTWSPTSPQQPNSPSWKTSFGGQDGCRLMANVGSDVVQLNPGKCAAISGGNITTSATSSFQTSITTKKVVLVGVTFAATTNGRWINEHAKFMGGGGKIKDPYTGQVLATVVAGTYYPELTLEFSQPIPLSSLIGRANGGGITAVMTIEAMRIFP